ncbi:hypothetical protein D3C71_1807470 [compost metagenome]
MCHAQRDEDGDTENGDDGMNGLLRLGQCQKREGADDELGGCRPEGPLIALADQLNALEAGGGDFCPTLPAEQPNHQKTGHGRTGQDEMGIAREDVWQHQGREEALNRPPLLRKQHQIDVG